MLAKSNEIYYNNPIINACSQREGAKYVQQLILE